MRIIPEVSKSSANPDLPLLGPKEVHVWFLSIKELATLDAFAATATLNELSVNQSIQSNQLLTRVQTRAALRILLAGYVKVKPNDLEFATGANGKPYLSSGDVLSFNVSHTSKMSAIAVSRATEVGVDVEMESPKVDCTGVARAYFCERETRILQNCEETMKRRLFLKYWVRKEACLKALGFGLVVPLSSLDVSDISEATIVSAPDGQIQRCQVIDLPCNDDHAAAVAVVEPQISDRLTTAVRVFQFDFAARILVELLKQREDLEKAEQSGES